MGVPAFYRWLSEKYPKIVQDVVEERVHIDPFTHQPMPLDWKKPNPSSLECDNLYSDQKIDFAKKKQQYPCDKHFQEAMFACSDDTFDCLLELAYYRKLNGITSDKYRNNDLWMDPTVYDAPDPSKNVKYTY